MQFKSPIAVVEDEQRSRAFYEELLGEELEFDFGACQIFKSGFTLQRRSSMGEIFKIDPAAVVPRAHSVVLYYETEDLDEFLRKLEARGDIEYVHGLREYDWGQRSVCLYDPDGHVVDVSESMACVFRRFFAQGMSAEQVAQRTEHPLDFVLACRAADGAK